MRNNFVSALLFFNELSNDYRNKSIEEYRKTVKEKYKFINTFHPMGRYINEVKGVQMGASYDNKCLVLKMAGAKKIEQPTEFKEDLVCVVNNGPFAAAAFVFNDKELKAFSADDGRPKTWFILENAGQYAHD